jgi:hypothetical protein
MTQAVASHCQSVLFAPSEREHSSRYSVMRQILSRGLPICLTVTAGLLLCISGIADPPPLADYQCRKTACKTMQDTNEATCSQNVLLQTCRFTDSAGDVIWCAVAEGRFCVLLYPIESNTCTGICTVDGVSTCTHGWAKCANPK